MALAAWMLAREKHIISVSKVPERRREFLFVFRDSEHECDALSMEFLNSDAHAFDTAMRALKKMCFGPNGLRGTHQRQS